MKKLLFSCAAALAAACALGDGGSSLWTAYEGFSAYTADTPIVQDGSAANTLVIPIATVENGVVTPSSATTSWTGKWYTTATSIDSKIEETSPATASSGKYLNIDASDGELVVNISSPTPVGNGLSEGVTFASVDVGIDDRANEGEDGAVFIDTMVQFTESESAPDLDPEDKIVVWYAKAGTEVLDFASIDENDVTNTTSRTLSAGLKITAMRCFSYGDENEPTLAYVPYVYDVSTPSGTDFTNGWHRLTIKTMLLADDDEGSTAGVFAQVFRVYLDGAAKPLSALQSHNLEAGNYSADNTMFVSLTFDPGASDTDSVSSTLTAVAFRGQGKIDDFVFASSSNVIADASGAKFLETALATTHFTITAPEGVDYQLFCNEVDTDTTYQGSEVTIEVTVGAGFTPAVTADGAAVELQLINTNSENGKKTYSGDFTAKVDDADPAEEAIVITVTGISSVNLTIAENEYATVLFAGAAAPSTLTPGTEYTFTATAAEGYKVTGVTATGATLTDNGNGSYTFTAGYEDVTITVATAEDNGPYYVTGTTTVTGATIAIMVTPPEGTAAAYDAQTGIEAGSTVVITVTPATSYTITSITVNGTALAEGVYTTTITDVAADITLNVVAEEETSGETVTDTEGSSFTVDTTGITLPTGVESITASTGVGNLNYAQAYALGLWDGTAEGTVSAPAVSIEIVNGQVQVVFAGGENPPDAYTVSCTLQSKAELSGTWTDVVENAELGETMTDASTMGEKKFYRVLVTITDVQYL